MLFLFFVVSFFFSSTTFHLHIFVADAEFECWWKEFESDKIVSQISIQCATKEWKKQTHDDNKPPARKPMQNNNKTKNLRIYLCAPTCRKCPSRHTNARTKRHATLFERFVRCCCWDLVCFLWNHKNSAAIGCRNFRKWALSVNTKLQQMFVDFVGTGKGQWKMRQCF